MFTDHVPRARRKEGARGQSGPRGPHQDGGVADGAAPALMRQAGAGTSWEQGQWAVLAGAGAWEGLRDLQDSMRQEGGTTGRGLPALAGAWGTGGGPGKRMRPWRCSGGCRRRERVRGLGQPAHKASNVGLGSDPGSSRVQPRLGDMCWAERDARRKQVLQAGRAPVLQLPAEGKDDKQTDSPGSRPSCGSSGGRPAEPGSSRAVKGGPGRPVWGAAQDWRRHAEFWRLLEPELPRGRCGSATERHGGPGDFWSDSSRQSWPHERWTGPAFGAPSSEASTLKFLALVS